MGLLCVSSNTEGQETGKAGEAKGTEAAVSASSSPASDQTGSGTSYVPVVKYDPSRNAEQDIQNAVAEAKHTSKRVLVEVGGLWCGWCRLMDEFFEKHTDVLALREEYFVMVKVNYSDENKNTAVLSRYPRIAGYPHIFVLGVDGTLLHSQDTGELEEGKGYNLEKFNEFLKQWATAPADAAQTTTAVN